MALSKIIEEMRSVERSELTLENIGYWPLAYRFLALLFVCTLILVGFYYGSIDDQNVTLQKKQTQEITLKKTYKKKAFEAANIQALRDQMVELKNSFGALLKQLPKEREVPGLLEDIDEVGRGSSVSIKDMVLQAERDAEYFVELPISIVAKGGYHDFGTFVGGISALPRIVTLHDFELVGSSAGSNLLTMRINAKTYRYKPQGEE